MKKFDLFIVVATIVAMAFIMVYFNIWCASLPRTTLLWSHGTFSAYAEANILGLCVCGMMSLPLVFVLSEYHDDKNRR